MKTVEPMGSSFRLRRFLKTWRTEVRKHQRGSIRGGTDHWEGAQAWSEIKRADIQMVLIEQRFDPKHESLWAGSNDERYHPRDWRMRDLIQELSDEADYYILKTADVTRTNAEFKDAERLLRKALRALSDNGGDSVSKLLAPSVKALKTGIHRVRHTQREFWRKGSEYGEAVATEDPSNFPTRQIDSDTRLQLRLARILRIVLALDNISIRTISRLIVLFYICAGFATEHEDQTLRITRTNKELKVADVEKRLRHHGISKLKVFG